MVEAIFWNNKCPGVLKTVAQLVNITGFNCKKKCLKGDNSNYIFVLVAHLFHNLWRVGVPCLILLSGVSSFVKLMEE